MLKILLIFSTTNMPRRSYLNQNEKLEITRLQGAGEAIRAISTILNRSKTSIFNYIKNPENYGGTLKRGPRPKISPRTKRQIIKEASNNMTSCAKIKQKLDLDMSREAVRKVLVASNHMSYRKINQKQALTKKQKSSRIQWSINKVGWQEQWTTILFSDEKKWNLDGPDGFAYYWHDFRKEPLIFSKRQFGGGSVMTWAGFSSFGRTPIAFTTHRIDSKTYQKTLEDNLLPYFRNLTGDNGLFQQDNATCHKSASTTQWFKDNNINLLEHPSRSPDLNPMENLWGILARDVYEGGRQFDNVNDLKRQISVSWDKISNSTLQNLTYSMPRRVAEVLLKRGGQIEKYN